MKQNQVPIFKDILSVVTQTALGTSRDDELVDTVRKSWRRRISGTFLLFMYFAVFFTVIMGLTAYQIQTRVHSISNQPNNKSIWSIIRIADEVLKRELQIDNQRKSLSKRESELSDIEEKLAKASSTKLDLDSQLVNLLMRLETPISVQSNVNTEKLLEAAVKGEKDSERGSEVSDLKKLYTEQASIERRQTVDKKVISDTIQALKLEITELNNTKTAYEKSNKDHLSIADLSDELRFFKCSKIDNRNSLIEFVSAYVFGCTDGVDNSRSTYLFITLPSEVLIMLIVVVMGMMGSMISITQVFFAGEDRPITFYIFRPLFGAVVAIGLYVIIKAGVIVASNSPIQADGTAKLNAFFISFTSLIAGLMSEAAIVVQ